MQTEIRPDNGKSTSSRKCYCCGCKFTSNIELYYLSELIESETSDKRVLLCDECHDNLLLNDFFTCHIQGVFQVANIEW